jgi:DNA-binding CsgD family transcriptional regulator
MSRSSLTYLNFSDQLHYLKSNTDIEQVSQFFRYINRFQGGLPFFREFTFFIIDYTSRRHILMTGPVKDICGFHARDFLDGGLEFVVDIYNKDDFRVWNAQIFPSTCAFLREQPQEDHENLVFEFNYRMRREDGTTLQAMQKGSFITDPVTKLPTFGFGIAFDISSVKRDNCMTRTISRVDPETNKYIHIGTEYYYPDLKDNLLTKREREIVLRIADGLGTKQIADKLNLSVHTIMNHRKNILRKTNTKNMAGLIVFAIKTGLI